MAPASDAGSLDAARRALAAGVLVALAALCGPSCTSVLGLDGFQSAPASLCDKLTTCYADGAPPSCQPRVVARLAGAPDKEATWLQEFSSDTCLLSCASARRCLDLRPVCADTGDACDALEDCCGFVLGEANCVGGVCCVPSGLHCSSDSDCCSNAGYCDNGQCGNRVCQLAAGPCRVDSDCCTLSCVGFQCAATICSDDGFECALDTDCCSGHCETNRVCGTSCAPSGGACRADEPCCDGLMCFMPPGADSGVCSTGSCLPQGVECVPGLPCCDGLSCDPTSAQCAPACVPEGGPCAAAGQCCSSACVAGQCAKPTCSEAYCATDADCCSQKCLSATCKPSCQTNATCHDLCAEGGPLPLAPVCATAAPLCVSTVCAKDPYCCCSGWDTLCISQVAALATPTGPCAGACP